KALQIAPKRGPKATVVVVPRHVEEQPFRRPQKIRVEHSDQLTCGEGVRWSKQDARKNHKRKESTRPQKIRVENSDQPPWGEVVRGRKEAARKNLQRKVSSRLWKTKSIKELRR